MQRIIPGFARRNPNGTTEWYLRQENPTPEVKLLFVTHQAEKTRFAGKWRNQESSNSLND